MSRRLNYTGVHDPLLFSAAPCHALTDTDRHWIQAARPAAGKRVVPLVMNSLIMLGVGLVFMKASVSASTGVHCDAEASLRRVHSQPLTQPSAAVQWAQGSPLVGLAPRRPGDVHREAHSLTQAW